MTIITAKIVHSCPVFSICFCYGLVPLFCSSYCQQTDKLIVFLSNKFMTESSRINNMINCSSTQIWYNSYRVKELYQFAKLLLACQMPKQLWVKIIAWRYRSLQLFRSLVMPSPFFLVHPLCTALENHRPPLSTWQCPYALWTVLTM